jgi:hypothetical protein
MTAPNANRGALVRRGLWLICATIAYNSFEAVASLVAGVLAGSVALVGFGIDSVIEVTASGAAQWRLRADVDHVRREQVERITLRVIGWSFLALAAYVAVDAARTLWPSRAPTFGTYGAVFVIGAANITALSIGKGPEPAATRALAEGLRPNEGLELLRSRQSELIGVD